jgi:derlin-1
MIASDFLMSGSLPRASIAGMVSSHIYYYLATIYPSQGGRRFLETPQFLRRLFPATMPRGGFRGGFGRQDEASSSSSSAARNTNLFGRHSWGSGQRLGS